MRASRLGHCARECVVQAGNDLKHREVGVRQSAADQVAPVVREHLLEIAQEFGRPIFQKIRRAAPRFRLLILIIKIDTHGMMRVVDFNFRKSAMVSCNS